MYIPRPHFELTDLVVGFAWATGMALIFPLALKAWIVRLPLERQSKYVADAEQPFLHRFTRSLLAWSLVGVPSWFVSSALYNGAVAEHHVGVAFLWLVIGSIICCALITPLLRLTPFLRQSLLAPK